MLEAILKELPSHFQRIESLLREDIFPKLREKETERRQKTKRARIFTIAGIALGLAIASIGLMGIGDVFPYFVGGFLALAIGAYGMMPVTKLRKEAKAIMVLPIIEAFDFAYSEQPRGVSEIHEFRQLQMVPGWDRSSYQDRIVGTHENIPFLFFEAHLEQKRTTRDSNGNTRTTWVTVFNGQLLKFPAPKTFEGTTIITRDSGIFNAFKGVGKTYDRAKLESPDFERAFEVVTTDQVEARYILTPDVMQRYNDLERSHKGASLRAAYDAQHVYIAMANKNMFEPGSMFTPFDRPDRIKEFIDDFEAIFGLLETLGR